MAPPARILVLDLGDVLFHYDIAALTKLSPKMLQSIITSPEWEALERGELNEEEALQRIAAKTNSSLHPSQMRSGLSQCRVSLHVDDKLLQLLIDFKEKMKQVGSGMKVYAMTNVSQDDFTLMKEVMKKQGLEWDLFDGIFTSFEAGMRKPEPRFYEHVIQKIGAQPNDIIFVDDKTLNITAATALGIQGLVFTGREKLIYQLHLIYMDPRVLGGKAFLNDHARKLANEIEGGEEFDDAFSQFLIMEATNDLSLLHLDPSKQPTEETEEDIERIMSTARQWNYFIRQPVGTTADFPNDIDTTACSLLAFAPSSGAHEVLDSMLQNRNADGLVQTYWDATRPRVDFCVLCNVVRAFYKYGRGADVQESLAFITKALRKKEYISGSRHYCTPETFLFFLAQLVSANPSAQELQALREPLIDALRNRMAVYENEVTRKELDLAASDTNYEAYVPEVDSLAIAMRILACQLLSLRPTGFEQDILRLTSLQEKDGGWPLGWLCRYGRTKARIGNRGVVTAYAVKAIKTDITTMASMVDVADLEEDERTGYEVTAPGTGPYAKKNAGDQVEKGDRKVFGQRDANSPKGPKGGMK